MRSDHATVGPQKSMVPKTVAHQNPMVELHKNVDIQPHFTIWIWIFFISKRINKKKLFIL